ncbi:hypothetical protein BD410DRAFT_758817 [Rickenella mellea]|uniref:COP9 signalosome complex subunit 4 n=1 Tax=Rickenella mellea TaxID=50990 RepID=A0A4R5XHK2_9AGAM|nr:hypothetical protein BD410DRAFT_758817 [Rickenella mellea]
MDQKLEQLQSLSQKDKPQAYSSLLTQTLAQANEGAIADDVHRLLDAVITHDHGGLVVGRQVLAELVKSLSEGTVKDREVRKQIVKDALAYAQPRLISFEEQVNSLCFQLADLLEEEEEWSEAARVLMGISMDSGQRTLPDEEKLKIYIRIVRLLLEDEDSVQAETYYNRAALLVNTTNDRETVLAFKLCQARLNDYTRKFLEAASRYHELSWTGEIDEDERTMMLSAAVTCAVLAPAGPNRSRVLAALCRDERSSQLPTYGILSKMFLDHILRPAEVQKFEATLKPHQLAKISQSSNDRLAAVASAADGADDMNTSENISTRTGPSTVLDRAVMEHNVLASSKIYNNISFSGLGTLLDLTPGAAETMARRMIEQGRLKGSIDQVERLIWFESGGEEDDAQGKAGGLGDVDQQTEDTGSPYTKKWDMQIRMSAASVESIVQYLTDKGLLHTAVMT